MLGAALIVFREVLEAALIVAIVMGATSSPADVIPAAIALSAQLGMLRRNIAAASPAETG